MEQVIIRSPYYGRLHDAGRVKYLVDPKGLGDERAIPEQVVLRRWRRRRFPGHVFVGERLSPTLWRALPAMLGVHVERWAALDVNELARLREHSAPKLRDCKLSAPSAETTFALIETCGTGRMAVLVDRHRAFGEVQRSGVPDLFLFARNKTGSAVISRFVEVKKPEERLSGDQTDEVNFMRELGLPARVLRLIER